LSAQLRSGGTTGASSRNRNNRTLWLASLVLGFEGGVPLAKLLGGQPVQLVVGDQGEDDGSVPESVGD